ncbi:extracellular solute-binding protein [Brevibacillus dissolubilis]|uniref:extracellular solute-binding protein n=1 Tax=Brevibacillus dissolubilis TaxID=1844116 RepID=UPI0011176633|nr:extracellular solute-binding protein [Brevibacillus dissolubilis]
MGPLKNIALSAALLSLAVLSGCGSAATTTENSTTDGAKEVTLSLRHTQIKETTKTRLKILEDVVKQTETNNPGLKIELEGVDENVNRNQKLKAEMAAGNPPEIFEMFGGSDTQLYVKAGRLLDLTEFLETSGLKDQFVNLEEFTVDGKIYGLPFGGYAEGVFYNKKLFQELGIEVPKTWDEFVQAAEKLKAAGKVPLALAAKDAWVNGMLFNSIWERHVGINGIEGLVNGSTKWTDPNMVKAFEDYAVLVNNGYFTNGALGLPYSEQGAQFLKGDTGMVFTGSWDANRFTTDEAGALKGNIGFFRFPSIAGGAGDQTSINAGYSNGFGFSNNVSPEQKEKIYAFIKEFYSEEVQKRTLLEDKVLPSMKLSDLSGVDPLIAEVIQTINGSTSAYKAFDAIVQPSVNTALGNSLQELIGKVKTPQDVAEKMQKEQEKANKSNK